jgi:hypothetical protein
VSDLTSARWDDDDALLTELRAALDVPAVPEHVVAAAKAAYTWRTIDEELAFAVLVYDSSLDDSALVRGEGPRTLLFEGDQLSVEIEVTEQSVIGQLIPPGPGRITLTNPAGPVAETDADEVGCFVLPRPGRGAVRLICRCGEDALCTPWLPL